MVSTSGVAGKSDEERAQPLKTNPEMASLTTGSLNFAGRKPSIVYVNTWETVTYLAKNMPDRYDKKRKITAIARTTAYTTSIVAQLVARKP